MTTLTDSSSLTIVTSSEIFVEFSVRDLKIYSHSLSPYAPLSTHKKLHLLPNGVLSELQFLSLTPRQIVQLLQEVHEAILNTKEGAQYEMEKLFLPDEQRLTKRKGMPPGIVRIFSKELASYYTGKSWKKIKIPANE